MLTRAEFGWNLRWLKLLCYINFLPLEVLDHRYGLIEIQRQRIWWKKWIWWIFYTIGLVYVVRLLIIFSQAIFDPRMTEEHPDALILLIAASTFFPLSYIWAFLLYIVYHRELAIVFNWFFDPGHGRGQGRPEPKPRPIFTRDFKYTRHELITLGVPFATFGGTAFGLPVLASDPDRAQLLYSSVPEEYKNVASFLVCMMIEAALCFFTATTLYFSDIVQMLMLERSEMELDNLEEYLKNPAVQVGERELKKVLKKTREIIVAIKVFNRVFCFIIYVLKLACLVLCIYMWYFAIRHYQEHPLMAAFSTYMGIVVTGMYAILYEKAFHIPEKLEDLKSLIAQRARGHQANGDWDRYGSLSWREVRAVVAGIEAVGIQVGSFHPMERLSAPIFLDFVCQKVTDLLIAS